MNKTFIKPALSTTSNGALLGLVTKLPTVMILINYQ